MPTFSANNHANYRTELVITPGTPSVAGNYTDVKVVLRVVKLSGSGYWSNDASSWSTNINGVTASGTFTYDFRNYTTLTLYTTTVRINHDSDGSKSFASSASVRLDGVGTASPSGSTALITIPRASSITKFANHTIGSNIAWAVDRKHAAFTHTVELHFGGTRIASATNQGASGTLGITQAMKEQMLRLIPNSATGTATLRVRTFNGSTTIGDWASKNATATAGNDIVPTVSDIAITEAVISIRDLVGDFVQGHSKANLSVTGATGVFGSTIRSYRITGAGNTINAQTGVSNILGNSGLVEFTAVVTDSRGRTATIKRSITVLKYEPPNVIDFTTMRTNSAGNELWNGTFLKAMYHVKTQSLIVGGVQKNNMTITIRRRQNGSSFFEQVFQGTFSEIERNAHTIASNFDVTFGYDIEIILSDIFGVTFTSMSKITTGKVALDIGDDNIGVGKLWEQGTIDAAHQIYQNDGEKVASLNDLIPHVFNYKSGKIEFNNTVISVSSPWTGTRLAMKTTDGPLGHGISNGYALDYDCIELTVEGFITFISPNPSGLSIQTSLVIQRNGVNLFQARSNWQQLTNTGGGQYGGTTMMLRGIDLKKGDVIGVSATFSSAGSIIVNGAIFNIIANTLV